MFQLILKRKFLPLLITQFLGAFNDNIFKNALAILITYKNIELLGLDTASLVALCGGIFILPYFFLSAISGQISEHFQKAKIIKYAKFLEVLIMAMASIGFYLDNYVLLLISLFLMGAQSSFFGPVKYGILIDLVKTCELVAANALVTSTTFFAILIGTIFGGTLASFDSYLFPITITLLGISSLGLLSSLFQTNVTVHQDAKKIDYNIFRTTKNLLKQTYNNKVIFRALMGISWFWFFGAALLSLIPIIAKDNLHGTESVATFFLGIFTLGMGAGSLIAEKLSRGKEEMGIPAPVSFLMAIALFCLVYLIGYYENSYQDLHLIGLLDFLKRDFSLWISINFFLVCFLGGLYIISFMCFIQLYSKTGEVSLNIAGNNIWNSLFMVGAAVFIMLLRSIDIEIENILLIVAFLQLAVSYILYYIYIEESLRFVMSSFAKLMYRVEVRGKEKLPLQGPYIIVSNHVSYVDWLLLMSISPKPVRFIIDYAYYYLKPLNFWFKQAKLIPIAKRSEDEKILNNAFVLIKKFLDTGHILGLFPEGTLTRDGKIRRFQPGLNRILSNSPVPIYPICIDGLWGSFFSREGRGAFKKFPKEFRPKIRITIGDKIEPENYNLFKLEEIVKEMKAQSENQAL